eukprot:1162022-Pelagomonas_calceolata.AAC.2
MGPIPTLGRHQQQRPCLGKQQQPVRSMMSRPVSMRAQAQLPSSRPALLRQPNTRPMRAGGALRPSPLRPLHGKGGPSIHGAVCRKAGKTVICAVLVGVLVGERSCGKWGVKGGCARSAAEQAAIFLLVLKHFFRVLLSCCKGVGGKTPEPSVEQHRTLSTTLAGGRGGAHHRCPFPAGDGGEAHGRAGDGAARQRSALRHHAQQAAPPAV